MHPIIPPFSLSISPLNRLKREIIFCTLFAATFGLTSAQDAETEGGLTVDNILRIGQELWEEHAPAELQEEYRLPTIEEIESFLANIEADLAEGSIPQLAAYAPHARLALKGLRQFEGGESLADWLEPRIDYLDAAEGIVDSPVIPNSPKAPSQPPSSPPAKPTPSPQFTQSYWNETIAKRPTPEKAKRYMPVFKKAFREKGVPPELAWLSEVESSLNLQARSPVGAYGPFQFMPATAERFGLHIGSPDDRAHPRKSAEAAASYLAVLYKQFQSWPLAIAAYNAGEGRVGRALAASGAKSFEELSPSLPPETRMYVPKVFATISARESIDPTALPGLLATGRLPEPELRFTGTEQLASSW